MSTASKGASAAPRYQRIQNYLVDLIVSGRILPDEKIESENELAERFGVSRLTVQRALQGLVSDGYLTRVQGSGTFVRDRAMRFSLLEVRDLAEEMRARGAEPITELLVHRRVQLSADTAALMEVPAGAAAFHIRLLQSSPEAPIAIEERFLRPDYYPDCLAQDFTKVSVYDYLAARSSLGEIETTLRAVMPGFNDAALLRVEPGEPCLSLERRNWWKGAVATVTRFTYAGQRYTLGSRYRPSASTSG